MIVAGHHRLEAGSLDSLGDLARISGDRHPADLSERRLADDTNHHGFSTDVGKWLVG